MHIDTLLGQRPDDSTLPSPETDAQGAAWKEDLNIDNLIPDNTNSEPTPAMLDPSFPYPHGPGHLEATPQQLGVMCSMLRAAGVSSFRPDFSQPASSKENKFFWALAFRIFIKLVECGEYSGVSLDAENIPHLKKLMNTRVRSLTKKCAHPTSQSYHAQLLVMLISPTYFLFRYQQETWESERKKRAASSSCRCARLRYVSLLSLIHFHLQFK